MGLVEMLVGVHPGGPASTIRQMYPEAIVWHRAKDQLKGKCVGHPMETLWKSTKRFAWAGHMGRVSALRAMGSGITVLLSWHFASEKDNKPFPETRKRFLRELDYVQRDKCSIHGKDILTFFP